jgi:hypothetical protein
MTLKSKFLTAFGAFLFILVLCAGCKSKNKSEEEFLPDRYMSLSASDTTAVTDLMNQYFDLLLKKDYDAAMSMIFQVSGDSLKAMEPEMEKHYQMGMKIVAPQRYEVESMTFRTELDCLVRYSAVLFDKESADDPRPNKMFYVIKPVRKGGEWFLTVADDDDLNTRDSRIQKD